MEADSWWEKIYHSDAWQVVVPIDAHRLRREPNVFVPEVKGAHALARSATSQIPLGLETHCLHRGGRINRSGSTPPSEGGQLATPLVSGLPGSRSFLKTERCAFPSLLVWSKVNITHE